MFDASIFIMNNAKTCRHIFMSDNLHGNYIGQSKSKGDLQCDTKNQEQRHGFFASGLIILFMSYISTEGFYNIVDGIKEQDQQKGAVQFFLRKDGCNVNGQKTTITR